MGHLSERGGATTAVGGDLACALSAWRDLLGAERMSEDPGAFAADTSSFTAPIPAVLRPETVREVQEIVRIAQRFRTPLYPVSTGKNWGYGTAVPAVPGGVIVDLSLMARILDFDEELGVVTVEPGVTQADLHRFLKERSSPFMVPVTGAGPTCSLVGNALERGFGITPITDHFYAVMSLSAVLPNGELYQSAFREFDDEGAARAFKWGVGPYLDGLFSQSGFGIVVNMSIALSPKPERVAAFVFSLRDDGELEGAAAALKKLMGLAGSNVGGVNLMSRERIKAMVQGSARGAGLTASGAQGAAGWGDAIPEEKWIGFGSIYGGEAHYRATRKVIKDCLRGRAERLRFITDARLIWLRRAGRLLRQLRLRRDDGSLERLAAAYGIVQGTPSTVALNLAYAKSGEKPRGQPLNPAVDGCGLLWYSPIVPIRAGSVTRFVEFAESVCQRHGFEAPITLTCLSVRCFASTVPLLFDPRNADEGERARRCYTELFLNGRERGFLPYRVGTQFMSNLVDRDLPSWRLADRLKEALDPEMILAPGRYSSERAR